MPCAIEELIELSSIPRLKQTNAMKLPNAVQMLDAKTMEQYIEKNLNKQELRIESYAEFHPEQRAARGLTVLRGLRVKAELEHEADRLWKEMGGKSTWLGVHYRGTDHVKCQQESPVENFVPYLVSANGEAFLATDEFSVKDMLATSFNLRTVGVELGRMTSQQQIHGVLEWLLLHKCGRVLQSAGSSFSELVTLRNGGILIKAQKHTPLTTPITQVTQGN
jgi:hypothetical protein